MVASGNEARKKNAPKLYKFEMDLRIQTSSGWKTENFDALGAGPVLYSPRGCLSEARNAFAEGRSACVLALRCRKLDFIDEQKSSVKVLDHGTDFRRYDTMATLPASSFDKRPSVRLIFFESAF